MYKLLPFLLAINLQATTVSLHLKTPAITNVTKGAFVKFELKNYGSTVPKTSGSIIVPSSVNLYPDSNGLVSGTIIGNDVITPNGTYYTISYILDGKRFYSEDVTIIGSSLNLDSGTSPPSPPVTTAYFKSNFESGELTSPYSSTHFNNTDPNISINSNLSFVHNGLYSGQIHYNIPSCPIFPCTQDSGLNIWYGGNSPIGGPINGLSSWNLRYYIYLKHPEVGATVDGIQRKTAYLWSDPSNPSHKWSVIVGGFGTAGALPLIISTQAAYTGGCTANYYPSNLTLNYDTWYSIELEERNDTSSGVNCVGNTYPTTSCNGTLNLYVNGTQYHLLDSNLVDVTNHMCLNLGHTDGIQLFILGQQAQTQSNNESINEYRYFNQVELANGYIGP